MINDVYLSLQLHSPDNWASAKECKDLKIDRVYIGSRTGGKTEDLMAAAKVFLASLRNHILLYMLDNSFAPKYNVLTIISPIVFLSRMLAP